MSELNYNIPAISCGHCKMTIENEVSELAGVQTVSVDVDSKTAKIAFATPASEAGILELLEEIGFTPAA